MSVSKTTYSPNQIARETGGFFDTRVGVLCLWDHAAFAHISDWLTWEQELLEDWDIERHIQLGNLVPVTTNSPGSYHLMARAGTETVPASLSKREQTYLLYTSTPYRLKTKGVVCLGALEDVGGESPPQGCMLQIPPGEYQVTVHWIRWDHEPGAQTMEGLPAPGALPDFLLLINPLKTGTQFRSCLQTFD